MDSSVKLDDIYIQSETIVARDIEGEIVIVPLVSGVGDLNDELFSLNATGKVIWERLDGKLCLADIIVELASEFDAPKKEIEENVLGFIAELKKRSIVIAK